MPNTRLKLTDFDLRQIENWTQTTKVIAMIVICVIVFIIGFLLIDLPQYNHIAKGQQQEEEAKLQLSNLVPNLMQYQEDKKEITRLQNLANHYAALVPKQEDLSTALGTLTQLATVNQLNLTFLKPEAIQHEDYFSHIPIALTASGNYMQIANFMKQIVELNYYLYIDKFNLHLAKDNDNNLLLEMTVDLYYWDPNTMNKQAEMNHANKK